MGLMTTAQRAVQVFRSGGVSGVAAKAVARAYDRWGDRAEDLHLRPADVADSARTPRRWESTRPAPDAPLTIGWILSGLAEGSGGHTTIFRMVEALERAGHRCVLYVYDGVGGGPDRYRELLRRWWPGVRAEVRDVGAGLSGCDGYVATAWSTAHVLAGQGAVPGARFYLAQDYEPYFYPRGAAYELAAESYRFGFTVITIGDMVADELREHHGLRPAVAPFGCDTRSYRPLSSERRSGVVFYAKPGIARRGYELGALALQKFHAAQPAVPIHTFGIRAPHLAFPAEVHAHMRPHELNLLYNRCSVGLALSFTNISLIATELLAAGVVPVVNDHAGSRADLDNPFVAWVRPTPDAVAEGIERAQALHERFGAHEIAQSVAHSSWRPAGEVVVETIETGCRAGALA